MSESMRKPRTLTMSIRGEFINDLALEKCHLDYDICYAVDLLMGSLPPTVPPHNDSFCLLFC